MRPQRAGLIGFVLMFASLGLAQNQQDALDILNRVAENYRSVKALQAEGDLTTGMSGPGMQQNTSMHVLMTLGASGKVRIESKTGLMTFLVVSDGQTTWLYLPGMNKYAKIPNTPNSTGVPSMPGGMHGLNSLAGFGNIADNVKDAKILRSESLQLDGINVDCYVIEFASTAPSPSGASSTANAPPAKVEENHETVWVDKSRLLVARVSSRAKIALAGESTATETQSTLTFGKLALDVPLADDAFAFTPPAGASEMDLSQFAPQAPSQQ
jgi:outer membrane lipoprotein-sorting protein